MLEWECDFSGFAPYNRRLAMNYASCPKCGHAPLPDNQAAPTSCPRCGVVFAKVAAANVAPIRRTGSARASVDETPGVSSRLIAMLIHVPDAVARPHWIARGMTLAVFCLWTLWILSSIDIAAGESGSFFLWAVLTPFHEAGHYLIFRWFGQFIMILGGTLGQHLMPVVLAGALLVKRRDPFGAALFTWLLGYSVVMMAVYMFDAFDPRMTLLDGRTGADSDGHDWQNIFGDLGLLGHARGIGIFFGLAGRAIMIGSLVWAGAIVWLQSTCLSGNPFAGSGPDA